MTKTNPVLRNGVLEGGDIPSSVPETKRAAQGLGAIFLLAVAVRFLAWRLDPALSRDGVFYLDLAARWLKSGDLTREAAVGDSFVPPLLPSLLKFSAIMHWNGEYFMIGLNILLGSLLCVLIYGIIRALSGTRKLALTAAVLTAVHPELVEWSIQVQRETLYLFFSGIFLLCAVYAWQKENYLWWLLCGMVWMFSIYSRLEGFSLFLWLAAGSLWMLFRDPSKRMKLLTGNAITVLGAGITHLAFCWSVGIPLNYLIRMVTTKI